MKKKANASGIRRVRGKEIRELSSLPWVRDETLSARSFEAQVRWAAPVERLAI